MIRCKTLEEARLAADWIKKHFPVNIYGEPKTVHYGFIASYPTGGTVVATAQEIAKQPERLKPLRNTTPDDYPYIVESVAPIGAARDVEPFSDEPGPWICGLGHVWFNQGTSLF